MKGFFQAMIGYGTRELTSLEYSAAGVVSGIATRGFVQPLDVLKIRFQARLICLN